MADKHPPTLHFSITITDRACAFLRRRPPQFLCDRADRRRMIAISLSGINRSRHQSRRCFFLSPPLVGQGNQSSWVAGQDSTACNFVTRPTPSAPRRAFSRARASGSFNSWGAAKAALDCARLSHPPTPSAPKRALVPGEHSFIVRVLRARRAPGHSLPPKLLDAASPCRRSTHCSCPIPPPPLWPSPHTFPPGERQSGAPVRPTRWRTGADS